MVLPIITAFTRAIGTLGGTLGKSITRLGSSVGTNVGIGIYQNAAIRFTGALGSAAQELESLQQVLLRFGTDYKTFSSKLSVDLKDLNGSILQNTKNAAALYGLGFRENNKNLLKVANVMDMTGQSTDLLVNTLPDLSFSLKLTQQEVGKLAITTLATGEKYGVATDRLIDTITKLPVFETAAQAGLEKFGTNLIDIIAKMGAMGPSIGKVINQLLTTEEGLRLSVAAGAGDFRKQLEKARSPQEAFNILKQIFQRIEQFSEPAQRQIKALGDSSIGAIMGTKMLEQTYGPLMLQMMKMNDVIQSFTLQQKEAGEMSVDYTDQLNVAISELTNKFLPIKELFLEGLIDAVKYTSAFVEEFKILISEKISKISYLWEKYVVIPLDITGKFFNIVSKKFVEIFSQTLDYAKYLNPLFFVTISVFQLLTKNLGTVTDAISKIFDFLYNTVLKYTLPGVKFGLDVLAESFSAESTNLPQDIKDAIAILKPPIFHLTDAISKEGIFARSYDRMIAENTKRTADASERQKELAEYSARASKDIDLDPRSSFATTYAMINRELMYAVTAFRVDQQMAQESEQITLLRMLVLNSSRGLDGNYNTPSKAGGV